MKPCTRRSPPLKSLTLGLGGLLTLGLPLAQGNEGEDDPFELAPFAVEAFALPFSVENFPGSTQVLTTAELAEFGRNHLAESLETVANLTLQSFNGNPAQAAIDLRGYGENGALRTLILVDGQPLNRVDMASVSLLEVPLGRVERVEILRGPQTARFGDFAVGGVINIITRLDPSDAPATDLTAGVGAFAERTARLHHRRPLGAGAFALSLDHTQSDGYRDNSGTEASSLGLSYARTFAGGSTLRLNGFYLDNHVEFPGALSGGPGGTFPANPRASQFGPTASDYFSDQQKANLTFALATAPTANKGTFTTRGGLAWRELEWNFGSGSHADHDQLDGRILFEYRQITDRIDWTLGLATQHNQLDFTTYRTAARETIRSEARLEKSSVGAYGMATYPLTADWTLSAALRAERHFLAGENEDLRSPVNNFDDSLHHDGTSAQLGLQGRIAKGLRAWLRYDRLYRFPVTDEIAAYQRFGLSEAFNRDLGPETGHNLELGTEWVASLGTFSVNAFAQRLDDEIAYDFSRNLNVNLAATERWGTELSYRVTYHQWDLRLAHTWLHAQFRRGPFAGHDVPLVSPHAFSAILTTPTWHRLRASFEVVSRARSYEGSDFANTQPPLPGWTVAHLGLEAHLTPRLIASFRVNNLFDHDHATLKFYGSWYPAPGRAWRTSLRWSF